MSLLTIDVPFFDFAGFALLQVVYPICVDTCRVTRFKRVLTLVDLDFGPRGLEIDSNHTGLNEAEVSLRTFARRRAIDEVGQPSTSM